MMTIQQKIDNGRQYRNMILEVKDISEATEQSYKVRGYATTFNEAYRLYSFDDVDIDEQVDARAFDNTDMSDVIFQYDHAGRVFARTSNNTLSLSLDEHGLLIEADLGGTETGRQLYEEIKGGYTSKMSFGFTVLDDDFVDVTQENGKMTYLRTIKSIGKLYDVSAVSLPANDGTEISARAYCDGVIAKMEAERLLTQEAEERKAKVDALSERINSILGGKN